MNGTAGLSAWRWLFILEGLPSLLSAIAVFFLLPDYPETTSWLTEQDKKLAADRLRLEGSHGESEHMTWADAKATLLDLRLYAHYIVSQRNKRTPNIRKDEPRTYANLEIDLLRHLNPLLIPLPLHPHHNRRPRLLRLARPTNDRPALRRLLRRNNPRSLERRPLQRPRPAQRLLRDPRSNRLPRISPPASNALQRPLRLFDLSSQRFIQLYSAFVGLAE
jgi:hypothetical protein